MDISGSYTFDAPPDRVWDAAHGSGGTVVVHSGLRAFEPDGEDRYAVTLTVGPRGNHRHLQRHGQSHRQDPAHVVPSGRGRAGTAGVREGHLGDLAAADGAATAVDVSGAVQTGGAIARVGQRLIGGVAKMMMDRFFACLQGEAGSARSTPASASRPALAFNARAR